jgi:hypothetical protein
MEFVPVLIFYEKQQMVTGTPLGLRRSHIVAYQHLPDATCVELYLLQEFGESAANLDLLSKLGDQADIFSHNAGSVIENRGK